MQNLIQHFNRVYIHQDAVNAAVTERVLSLFPQDKIEIVDKKPFLEREGQLSAREFSESKRLLYIAPFLGNFFKRCPGSRPGLACCNYFVLNWGVQCDMNCSYCYLQSFINSPVLTIYSNLDQALEELRQIGTSMGQSVLRVGTGETVDSLSLDPLTLYSHRLIEFFRAYPQWTLEFKTKSAFVEQFVHVPHANNVITSWSVNPQSIIAQEEHGTASLEERLNAAHLCQKNGFQLAFHIDPMIWHPEWKENYLQLVEQITQRFSPEQVSYLSVGGLRFQREQRPMMRERFGMKSYVTRAETFLSADGKMRYDSKLRQEMFQFVIDQFKVKDSRWRIFMCMETPETWLATTGESPFKTSQLSDLFESVKMPTTETQRDFQ